LIDPLGEDRGEHLVLGTEVVVHTALGDPGGGGDLFYRVRGVALVGNQQDRGVDDLSAGVLTSFGGGGNALLVGDRAPDARSRPSA
jgi:hypothetical protein